MMKKQCMKLLSIIMAAVLLGGCGAPAVSEQKDVQVSTSGTAQEAEQKSSEEVPLLKFGFVGGEVEQQAMEFALDGAEEKFGCEIEWVTFPDLGTLYSQLPAQVTAGTAPDFIAITNENYLEFVDAGLILDISPYITDEDYDFSRVTDQHKCWLIDDGIYGIPQDGGPACFIVNMDMWNEAGLGALPTTWEEVAAAAEALTTDTVKGLCVNINEFHITQYVLSFGGGWGEGSTINSNENASGVQYILDMYRKGNVITPTEAGLGWDGEVFCQGKAAMSTGGMWYAATIQELAPDMNYEIIPIPKGTTNACTGHSDTAVVVSSTKYPELAAKVIAYMGREESQNKIAELYGNPPAYKDLQEAFFESRPELVKVQEAMAYCESFGYPLQVSKFTDALVTTLEEALFTNDEMTGKEVLDKVNTAMEN